MQKFDETVDVLVVGSGCGGLTAALTANITNASKVLVIENSKDTQFKENSVDRIILSNHDFE